MSGQVNGRGGKWMKRYMEEGGEIGNSGSRAKPASFSVPDSTLNAIDRQIVLFFGSVAGEILAP